MISFSEVEEMFPEFAKISDEDFYKSFRITDASLSKTGVRGPFTLLSWGSETKIKREEIVFPYWYASNGASSEVFQGPPEMVKKPECQTRGCPGEIPKVFLHPEDRPAPTICPLCGQKWIKKGEIAKWRWVCYFSSCKNHNSGHGNQSCQTCYRGKFVTWNRGKGLCYTDNLTKK